MADSERSASAATSGDESRWSARASSSAVRPRAPHRAISSAPATFTGEKTVSVVCSASTWYRSVPNASPAAAAVRDASAPTGLFGIVFCPFPLTIRSHQEPTAGAREKSGWERQPSRATMTA